MTNERDMIEKMLFTHKVSQLSKALWKSIEKDWQQWIKPFDLNINEHHILIIIRSLDEATISEVSKYGVMHVSTVFNFAKNLEKRGYLTMPKSQHDKRTTYLELTDKGLSVLRKTYFSYSNDTNRLYDIATDYEKVMFNMPEFTDVKYIVGQIYGSDFIKHIEDNHEQLKKYLLDEQSEDDA